MLARPELYAKLKKKLYENKHPKELADQLNRQSEALTPSKSQAKIQSTLECVKTNVL